MSGFGFGARSGLHRLGDQAGARIAISGFAISEDAAPGTVVGALSVFGGVGAYSFSVPDGGDAGGRFALAGPNLATAAALDFETAPFHEITIEADNGAGSILSRDFVISVINQFEQPALGQLSISSPVVQGTTVAVLGWAPESSIIASNLPAGWALDGQNRQITISSDAPTGPQDWTFIETLDDSINSPNVSSGSSMVDASTPAPPPTDPTPSVNWDGTQASGFTVAPTDPVRITAKPAVRLVEPPHQHFTDSLTVGAVAHANNAGTLIGGITEVRFYFENDTPFVVTAPTLRTLAREDGSSYQCLGYWVDLQRPAGATGAARLYIEAVPADATMQNRVIGPFLFHPVETLHDWTGTVGESGDYATIKLACEAARVAGAANPRITLLDNGNYTLEQGDAAYIPTGYVTIKPATGASARLTLGTGNEGIWDARVGRFWFEDVDFDLATIAAIGTQSGAGHVLNRCRMERTGGAGLWFKNTPPTSYFVEGPAYLMECYSNGIYELGSQNAMLRGTINDDGYGDVTGSTPLTLYNEYRNFDWSSFASDTAPRMTITYSGAGSSVTLSRSFETSGILADRYRIFTLKVDGTTVLTFEAWQDWTRHADAVTNDGGTPPRVRGYEVQHFVDAVNALADFAATLVNNDIAARALNLQGSTDNTDFADTQIIAGTGSYDLICDIGLHAGGLSGDAGENYLHLFDQFTAYSKGPALSYSQNPGYSDVIVAGCVFDTGADAFSQTNTLDADAYSHFVFVHNSMRGFRLSVGSSSGTSTSDSYNLFSNNAVPRLASNTTPGIRGASNQLEDNVALSANFTDTLVAGSSATWFPNASARDFGAGAELATNPRPPVMTHDSGGNERANPGFVGASSLPAQPAQPAQLPYVVIGVLGQSNATGNEALEAQDVDIDGIAQYASNPNEVATFDTITEDITPLLHPLVGVAESRLGHGDYFSRQLLANGTIPPSYRILLVPCARPGTGLANNGAEWSPFAPEGSVLTAAIDQCTKAVTAAKAINADSYFAGYTWVQGERDAGQSVSRPDYVAAFTELDAQMRARIPGASNCWALVGSNVPERVKTGVSGFRTIAVAQRDIGFSLNNVYFDEAPAGLNVIGDTLHFSAAGQRVYGAQSADHLVGLIADPRLVMDFRGQELGDGGGATNIGFTNRGATTMTVQDGTGAGLGGKCISAAGSGALGSNASAAIQFPPTFFATDISAEWTANVSGRQCMSLRNQTPTFRTAHGYDGYMFQIDAENTADLFEVSGGIATSLMPAPAALGVTGSTARFRASAIGTRLTLEVSNDQGGTWTTVIDQTDAAHSAGGAAYMQGGNATNGGQIFAGDFAFRTALPAQ